MKSSAGSSSSRSVSQTTAAEGVGVAIQDGPIAASTAAASLQCKETLLSSSDTDDGEAPYSKLVRQYRHHVGRVFELD